jgi:hypothetical protein
MMSASDKFDDDEMPRLADAGRILFELFAGEVEIIDYDGDKAPFWLHEGGFMDYTVRDMVDLECDGFYVIEGVIGYFSKDYFGEYDETWEFALCRRATEEEIKTEALT